MIDEDERSLQVLLMLMLVLAGGLLAMAAVFNGGCAHTSGIVACADRLTPALENAAASALAHTDYEGELATAFVGVVPCVVVAAVEAAIEGARSVKVMAALSAPGGDGGASARTVAPEDASAVELHGQAWLAAHRRCPPSGRPFRHY